MEKVVTLNSILKNRLSKVKTLSKFLYYLFTSAMHYTSREQNTCALESPSVSDGVEYLTFEYEYWWLTSSTSITSSSTSTSRSTEYIFRRQTLHLKISCRHLLHKLEPLFLKLFI